MAGGGDGQELAGVEVGEDENEHLVGQHLDVVGRPDKSPAEARRIGVVGEVRVFEHLVAIFFEHGIYDGHGVGAEMVMVEGRREGGEAEALELDVLQVDLDLGVDEFICRAAVVEVVRVEVRGSKHPAQLCYVGVPEVDEADVLMKSSCAEQRRRRRWCFNEGREETGWVFLFVRSWRESMEEREWCAARRSQQVKLRVCRTTSGPTSATLVVRATFINFLPSPAFVACLPRS